MRELEYRFGTKVAKINRKSWAFALPESLAAMMLLAKSLFDSSQRFSILPAMAPSDSADDENAEKEAFNNLVKFELVYCIGRQSYKPETENTDDTVLMSGSSSTIPNC